MLFGRPNECERVDQLLAQARAGRSDALVLRGEAGIGKSALCGYAAEKANDMTVLRASGAPTESELAFSGLADVLRPLFSRLDKLPAQQAVALASALALGPSAPVGRFAICAATLSLLGAAAEDEPVLVIVDEAESLDRSSVEALLFAERRLDADRVALLFSVRDGRPTMFDVAELPELRLAPLERDASRVLLTSRAEVTIAPQVIEQLLLAAAGNPLALVEIPALLSLEQMAGTEPLGDELATAATIERAFLRQVESLAEASREALLVAAASDTGELDTIGAPLIALDIDPRSLAPSANAALVSISGGMLEFRHPLLRAAVYHTASAVARRAAHQALADAVAGERQLDRRAWHLAAAAPGRDDAAARALEEAALAARRRGGHAEAASAFDRAGRPGSEGFQRAGR